MKHVLFISYDGLLDPLGKSQILPYLIGLAKEGYRFSILSYEKTYHNKDEILNLKNYLKSKNINWHNLWFKKGRFQGIKRIINGAFYIRGICKNNKIDLIHLRAILPALIFIFSFVKKEFIYDIRSFAGQWVDTKAIKKYSLTEVFFFFLERFLVKKASGLIVLDVSGADYLKNVYKTDVIFRVIPTCTDTSLYKPNNRESKKETHFVLLGGAEYPYLPFEALNLIKQFIDLGLKCKIDCINKGDHKLIKEIANQIKFPKDNLNLFEIPKEDIPRHLINYDCGLVFIAQGFWLRMCSPTKVGEYLAAGLFVLALEGINVTDRLSNRYDCVHLVSKKFLQEDIKLVEAKKIFDKINSPNRSKISRNVAKENFELSKAVKIYFDLYNKIIPIR